MATRASAWRPPPPGARCWCPTSTTARTPRWPIFAAAVAEQTLVGALFALPLQWGTVHLGVLDMYRAAPGVVDDGTLAAWLRCGRTTAVLLRPDRIVPGTGPRR